MEHQHIEYMTIDFTYQFIAYLIFKQLLLLYYGITV